MRFEPKAATRDSPGALLGNLLRHPHQTTRIPSTLQMPGAGAARQVQTLHSLSGLCASTSLCSWGWGEAGETGWKDLSREVILLFRPTLCDFEPLPFLSVPHYLFPYVVCEL